MALMSNEKFNSKELEISSDTVFHVSFFLFCHCLKWFFILNVHKTHFLSFQEAKNEMKNRKIYKLYAKLPKVQLLLLLLFAFIVLFRLPFPVPNKSFMYTHP